MSDAMRATLVISMSLLAVGCGRKGALIYPDMLVPAAPSSVAAHQSGSSVKLQFALPSKDRAGRPMKGVAGVKISKRALDGSQQEVCRLCMTGYQLFRTVYLDHLPGDTQRFGERLILIDNDVAAGNNYSYSLVPFTAEGIDGAVSAADVRVVAPVPAPAVRIESFPTEVRLLLSSQYRGGHLLGYNVYRSTVAGTRSYQPLNKDPLKGDEYVDSALERGVRYRYTARSVFVQETGGTAESAESRELEGMLKDDE
ncbi:MAG: hypothetical protein PHI31_11790 [Desulfuromonadaceae bacterium]|nr:hypothetical protein [Desulfuromonadaceae bacterium]